MLVPRLNRAEHPELFLLSPEREDRWSPGSSAAHVRLRLRRWEIRRVWSGRALAAISFPMAYLLIMLATGTPAPNVVLRFMIGVWVSIVVVGAVCAEAVWRNRTRLEHLLGERLSESRG